jgi:hypothetical protein
MPLAFAEDRYERMTYRRCGASGLLLPAISLGAWTTFGGYRDATVARRCIYRAFDLGSRTSTWPTTMASRPATPSAWWAPSSGLCRATS